MSTFSSESYNVVVPPFARECIDAAGTSWGASFDHPFVRTLAEGTLVSSKFRFYQMQDARYLEAFADAAAIISTRCPNPDEKLWFLDAARMAIVVEGQLHVGYGKRLGYTPADIASIELTPNNRAYQNHMISCASRGTVLEAVAALAPCPWLYTALGDHLQRQMGKVGDEHPYADWLRMYVDPSFVDYMNRLLSILQAQAEAHDATARARAVEAFHQSCRYEWMFWQQAWEMQEWPV